MSDRQPSSMNLFSGLAQLMAALSVVLRHGGWQQWKDSFKFIARSLLSPLEMMRFCRFLQEDAELAAWMRSEPSLLFKPQRPYLQASLTTRQRVDRLIDHYVLFKTCFPEPLRRRLLITRTVTIASVADTAAGDYFITLERRERFDKEGELVARLYTGHQRRCLCTMAFTLGNAGQQSLSIGCIIGADHEGASFDIRNATRSLEGLRPANFLLETLRRLGWVLNVHTISGVGLRQHIYARTFLKRSAIRFDYDRFWTEAGATECGGLYTLDTAPTRLMPERYPSKKRAMIRRRQVLLDAVQAQIQQAFAVSSKLMSPQDTHAEGTVASGALAIANPQARQAALRS